MTFQLLLHLSALIYKKKKRKYIFTLVIVFISFLLYHFLSEHSYTEISFIKDTNNTNVGKHKVQLSVIVTQLETATVTENHTLYL